jgi:AraC-like DNA-binding protein
MQRLSDLLALWTALSAASRDPGRTRIVPVGHDQAPGCGLHPVATLAVALAGAARIECPGRRPYDLAPREAVVIAAGALHRHLPLRGQAATLELGFDYEVCDLEFHTAAFTVQASMPRQPAEELVGRLLAGEQAPLGILLGLILEQPLRDLQPLPAAARRMRDRIRSHGLTRISAADVAAASGLRQSRAWQLFQTHFGCTPRQALERRRCAIAASWLAQGMPVGEAASRCGFRDRGTFARAFRRVHGRPPGSRSSAPPPAR